MLRWRASAGSTLRAWRGQISSSVRSSGPLLLALSLAAGAGAQFLLDQNARLIVPGLLYLFAAILFVIVSREKRERSLERVAVHTRVNWHLVIAGCILGVLSFPRFSGNLFSASGMALWGAGLLLLGLATWTRRTRPLDQPADPDVRPAVLSGGLTLQWRHIALIGFMALGAFYRLYRIDTIPLEMGPDLPHIYNNIRMILRREFLIFFPSHPGREGLFFYLAAPVCSALGLTHVSIKIASALVGVATIPAIYLLGRELHDTKTGLLAAFFLSISHWHIIITRVGFRSCTMVLVLVLMWYAFLRGLKTGRPWFYALAGFFWGLGFYTYNAFMISFATVGGLVLVMALAGQGGSVRRDLGKLALMGLTAVFVFIPLGRYAMERPDQYLYRVGTRITGMEAPISGSIPQLLAQTVSRALLMFNYRGDSVFINNVPDYRELGFASGVLFVLGLAYTLWHWRHRYNGTTLVVLFTMLLPSALALAFPHEVPNAGRAFGAVVPAVILAARAAARVYQFVAQALSEGRASEWRLAITVDQARKVDWRFSWGALLRGLAISALVVVLAAEARAVYPLYFQEYVRHLPDQNYSISLEMARIIDDFSDDGETFIKIWPYWHDGNAVRAQLRREDQNWNQEVPYLAPNQAPMAGPPGKFAVIMHPQDVEAKTTLERAFPRGIAVTRHKNQGEPALVIFYGER